MKDLLEVNQSRMLGRRVRRSAALVSEIEYKSPATLEEENAFVIAGRDQMTQLMTVKTITINFLS